jgi:phage/plasmid-associated DNA primase
LRSKLKQPEPYFINFRNGILDTRTLTLRDHNREIGFKSVLDVDYDANAYPDEKLQRFLLNLVDNRTDVLNLLRGGIRRAIDPSGVF